MTLQTEIPRRPGRPTDAERARRLAELEIAQPRRWQLDDLDEWLLKRINFRWSKPELIWRGKLAGYAASNQHLFITNEQAVLFAEMTTHAMSGLPVVKEVFAFARSADFKDGVWGLDQGSELGEKALRGLYRQFAEWAKSMTATRVYVCVCSDMLPSVLKQVFPGAYYVVGAPC